MADLVTMDPSGEPALGDNPGNGIPIVDPHGQLGSAPSERDAAQLMQQGYRQPSPQELQNIGMHARYNTGAEKYQRFEDMAARSLLPFGIGTAIRHATAGNPFKDLVHGDVEAQQHEQNEELNRERYTRSPLADFGGSAVGLALGAKGLGGASLAGTISKAGEGAVGLTGASGTIIPAVVKGAVAQGMLSLNNDASRAIIADPSLTWESVIAGAGMNSLYGGAAGAMLGTVSLGAQKMIPKLTESLAKLQDQSAAAGVDPDAQTNLITQFGKLKAKAVGVGIGASIGHATGIPYGGKIGAVIGGMGADKAMGWAAPAVRSLLEKYANPEAIAHVTGQFLQGSGDLDGTAFLASLTAMDAAYTGQKQLMKGVKNILSDNPQPMPELMPKPKDVENLSKNMALFQKQPEKWLNMGGSLASVVPDIHQGLAQTAMRAHQLLQMSEPDTYALAPLDSERPASKVDQGVYARQMAVVQSPLSVLEKVREGNLTEHDLGTMETVYPALLNHMRSHMLGEIASAKSAGRTIPYQKRLVLSHFLGQNLDSTIGPMTLMTLKPPQPQGQPQQHGRGKPGGHKGKSQTTQLGKLKNIPGSENTMTQKAEQDRIIE